MGEQVAEDVVEALLGSNVQHRQTVLILKVHLQKYIYTYVCTYVHQYVYTIQAHTNNMLVYNINFNFHSTNFGVTTDEESSLKTTYI